jgi:hypothetical protein
MRRGRAGGAAGRDGGAAAAAGDQAAAGGNIEVWKNVSSVEGSGAG